MADIAPSSDRSDVARRYVDGARAAEAAAARLAPFALRTPLIRSQALGPSAWLKCENLQRTGSFKLRGALNKMLLLSDAERRRGVVTSSTGNHGLAVGTALRLTSGRGTAVVSASASPHKVERLAGVGLDVVTHDGDPLAAELAARALGRREGWIYVSPYNDADVMAGQGSVGVEIIEQCPAVEVVYVAVGGGGLVGGIASYFASVRPTVTVVGCWPANAPAMYASIQAGAIVEVAEGPTLSDGTAGNLEPGSITFPACRDLIDEHVLVSEAEIARAMRDVLLQDHLVIEGAAGVAVAAWRAMVERRPQMRERESVIVLCGGNVGAATLARLLSRG